jgi:hypothetical protein
MASHAYTHGDKVDSAPGALLHLMMEAIKGHQ